MGRPRHGFRAIIPYLICVSLGLSGCGPSEMQFHAAQTAESRRVALELIAAISRADADGILDLYADDVVVWTAGDLPFSGEHDKREVEAMIPAVLGLFPDGLPMTVRGITADGERVAIEAESEGRHVSGKLYNNRYHFLVIVRAGKVIALKEYMDTKHANEVLVESAQP